MKRLPNIITVFRMVLVAPIAFCLLHHSYFNAFALLVVAALSDLLDGLVARRVGVTRLGSILDPLADKLLMTMGFLCLAYLDILPFWLTGIVVIRDLYLIAGAVLYHYLQGPYHFRPSKFSKVNTVLQMVLLVCALFDLVSPELHLDQVVQYLGIIVAITSLGTALQYTVLSLLKTWKPLNDS